MLSGGGARGAYEAGVLSFLFEVLLPRLGPEAEFDIASGTSVGAVHAAYAAATRGQEPGTRAKHLLSAWESMRVAEMLRLQVADLWRIPLRILGVSRETRTGREVLGGLVDVSRLEDLVTGRIPWSRLSAILREEEVALCISCTEVRSGAVTIFMDGALADEAPWRFDPNARALRRPIEDVHVRASAAIPFLFPAVRIGDRYYVDGGLRMNTPLSPALRLGASRALVVCLKHPPEHGAPVPAYPDSVITNPSFLAGKVLNALTLDQLEYDLERLALVNEIIAQGESAYGPDFLDHMNVAVRARRGADYRTVEVTALRPSEDLGKMAGECFDRARDSLGQVARWLARFALHDGGSEADLLSYLLFDGCYTNRLIELGRADAENQAEEIAALLSPGPGAA